MFDTKAAFNVLIDQNADFVLSIRVIKITVVRGKVVIFPGSLIKFFGGCQEMEVVARQLTALLVLIYVGVRFQQVAHSLGLVFADIDEDFRLKCVQIEHLNMRPPQEHELFVTFQRLLGEFVRDFELDAVLRVLIWFRGLRRFYYFLTRALIAFMGRRS